jgi:TolA-binding protein
MAFNGNSANGWGRVLTLGLAVVIGAAGWSLKDRIVTGASSAANAERITQLERRVTTNEASKVSSQEFQSEVRRINEMQQLLLANQNRMQQTMEEILRRTR